MIRGAAQGALAFVALQRLARGKDRRPPLAAPDAEALAALPSLSVVIPARDEEDRLAGVLAPLAGAPGVAEVIVVDDCSTDATARIAREHGARVIAGSAPPQGWVGKPWALQQGLVAASSEVVVFLDADVRPDPSLPAAVTQLLVKAKADLASAQLRFETPGAAQRVVHPALLTTLVYRLGPLDVPGRLPASVVAINGQCFAVRRDALIRAGGFGLVAGIPTDDVALARALAAAAWRVAVADATSLGSVRMYESAGEAMREWAGRSLALPGASPRARQLLDLGVVWAVQGLPGLKLWWAVLRLAGTRSPRRAVAHLRPLDVVLLAVRFALVGALGRVYRRAGGAAGGAGPRGGAGARGAGARGGEAAPGGPDPLAFAAPLADPVAAAGLTRGTLWPGRGWRGRPF